MTTWKAAVDEQKRANEESWKQKDSFASHRAHLTELVMGTSPRG